MSDLQQVQLYPGNQAFAIQLQNGLSIHVDPGQNATLVFQNGDKPIISVKDAAGNRWMKPLWAALGTLVGVGAAVWWFRKE